MPHGFFTALLMFAAFAQERTPMGVNFYSIEKELAVGKQTADELAHGLNIVHDSKLDAYVGKIGAALAKAAGANYTYRFTLYSGGNPTTEPALTMPTDAFQTQTAEPVAVGGGAIFVSKALLEDSRDEAAFAFQIAHAMAHVKLRHGTKLASRQDIAGGAAPRLALLSTARQFELEADAEAVDMMAAAGYDPAVAVRYLQSQPDPGNRGMSEMYSAHPTTARRLETVRAEIQKLAAR